MRKLLLPIFILWLSQVNAQQIPDFRWVKEYTFTDSATYMWPQKIVSDRWGNTYLSCGLNKRQAFDSDTIRSYGNADGVLVKLGPDGRQKWLVPYGGRLQDNITGHCVLADGSLLVAGTLSPKGRIGALQLPDTNAGSVLARLDTNGRVVEFTQYPKARIDGVMTPVPGGGLWFACGLAGGDSIRIGNTAYHSPQNAATTILIKLDPMGQVASSRSLGTCGAYDMKCDSAGNVYIGGSRTGAADLAGLPVSPRPATALWDFVLKLNPNGEGVWFQELTYPYRIAVDGQQNVYVAGVYTDTLRYRGAIRLVRTSGNPTNIINTAYLAKINASSQLGWIQNLGVIPGNVQGAPAYANMLLYAHGKLSLCGFINSEARLGSTYFVAPNSIPFVNSIQYSFVAQADTSGEFQWAQPIIDGLVEVWTLCEDLRGDLLVSGQKSGETQYGTSFTSPRSSPAVFIAKVGYAALPTGTAPSVGVVGNPYPNPSQGVFYMDGTETAPIRVYDALGRPLMEVTGSTVDLTGRTPGVYWIERSVDRATVRKRVVLE